MSFNYPESQNTHAATTQNGGNRWPDGRMKASRFINIGVLDANDKKQKLGKMALNPEDNGDLIAWLDADPEKSLEILRSVLVFDYQEVADKNDKAALPFITAAATDTTES